MDFNTTCKVCQVHLQPTSWATARSTPTQTYGRFTSWLISAPAVRSETKSAKWNMKQMRLRTYVIYLTTGTSVRSHEQTNKRFCRRTLWQKQQVLEQTADRTNSFSEQQWVYIVSVGSISRRAHRWWSTTTWLCYFLFVALLEPQPPLHLIRSVLKPFLCAFFNGGVLGPLVVQTHCN